MKFNKVVKYLIATDFVLLSGWGLIVPVFAIFVLENIEGGSATVVGITAAIYWILKSIIQVPIAYWLDKKKSERDDYWALIIGLVMVSFVSLGLIWISKIWQLYLLQVFHAFAFALMIPSWAGIFTRHIDKGEEGLEWTLDSTAVGLASGVTGFLGGYIADNFGFQPLFIMVAFFALISVIFPVLAMRADGKLAITDKKPFLSKQKQLFHLGK